MTPSVSAVGKSGQSPASAEVDQIFSKIQNTQKELKKLNRELARMMLDGAQDQAKLKTHEILKKQNEMQLLQSQMDNALERSVRSPLAAASQSDKAAPQAQQAAPLFEERPAAFADWSAHAQQLLEEYHRQQQK